MKHYYINPIGGHLVIHDTETKELVIVERVESVKVFLGGEVRLGDFRSGNPDDVPENFDERGGYGNYIRSPKHSTERLERAKERKATKADEPRKRKASICKVCGKPGRADYHGHANGEASTS